jgi:histone H3/H4
MKKREFSLYDIEQFLRDAGAERVNEKAVVSLEKELEDTVRELVDGARMYASYAGREKLVKSSDVELAFSTDKGNAASKRLITHSVKQRPIRAMSPNRAKMQRLSVQVEARMLEQ